jgi:hypothetical protein
MKRKQNKTKKKHTNKNIQDKIVMILLEILNSVKMFHWNTFSHSQHKATDDLYSKLNENIDTFVEIMLGKNRVRVLVNNIHISDFAKQINKYKQFLINLNRYFDTTTNSDLLNVRDEILGNLNQFSYLLTLK